MLSRSSMSSLSSLSHMFTKTYQSLSCLSLKVGFTASVFIVIQGTGLCAVDTVDNVDNAVVDTADAVSKISGDPQSLFQGWAGLELIKLEGPILRSRGHRGIAGQIAIGDVTGNGRDDIILVHRQQSRLEIYKWLALSERVEQRQPEYPNDIPLANHLQHTEIQLDELPLQVMILDDRHLAILIGPEYRLLILKRHSQDQAEKDKETKGETKEETKETVKDQWSTDFEIKLLSAVPTRYVAPLVYENSNGEKEILILCDSGVQRVLVKKGSTAQWMRPRSDYLPWKWFLSDIDGDGDMDIVKAYAGKKHSLTWQRNEDDIFSPEQTMYKKRLRDMVILNRPQIASGGPQIASGGPQIASGGPQIASGGPQIASEIVVLDANGQGLLRRMKLKKNEDSEFGKIETIALPSINAPWTGVRKGGVRSLVAIDDERPQLIDYELRDGQWTGGQQFPCVDNIIEVVAPRSQAGILLLRRKDAAELYRSDWLKGRWSFPKPWDPDIESDADNTANGKGSAEHKRSIIALGNITDTIWWVQKEDSDILLYTWGKQDQQAQVQRYVGLAGKIEKAQWLGGSKILVQDRYARHPRLLVIVEGIEKEHSEAHIKSLQFEQIRLVRDRVGDLQAVRIADGVVQWLDDDLHARDQMMLADGQSVSDFMFMHNQAYALQRGGKVLHKLAQDAGGVLRSVAQYDVPGGHAFYLDEQLGFILEDNMSLRIISRGSHETLQIEESVDDRAIRAKGLKDSTMHRLFAVDVFSSLASQVLVCDDERHRMSLFNLATEGLIGVASWQVFEDGSYPYGEADEEDLMREPRFIESLHFDDDQRTDLIMVCHDRLLIYVSKNLNKKDE